MKTSLILGLMAVLTLVGCSSGQPEKSGPAIDVYPVSSSLALSTKLEQRVQAQQALDEFIAVHHQILVTQPVVLFSATERSDLFVEQVAKQLRRLGVATDKLSIIQQPFHPDVNIDFKIAVINHHVVVPLCSAAQISRFGQEGRGCYAESLRWQSMVNPQKMVLSSESTHPHIDVNGE
ncbi:hypothetical protein [Vibrio metschnikovii]|uniref:hypothetical protein n=1 Tax=Vibrio metschnikovii TaxID=28172 RepID=UPI001C30B433|nr:hypothetical protein [Vibrio metschnikovii]